MNKNKGRAAGKTKQTQRTIEGFTHAKTVQNANATADFLKKLDEGWRNFFLSRQNTLPHVPTSYLITHDGDPTDMTGLSPL